MKGLDYHTINSLREADEVAFRKVRNNHQRMLRLLVERMADHDRDLQMCIDGLRAAHADFEQLRGALEKIADGCEDAPGVAREALGTMTFFIANESVCKEGRPDGL